MKRLYRSLAHNYTQGGIGLLAAKSIGVILRKLWSADEWRIYEHDSPQSSGPPFTTLHKLLAFEDLVALGYAKALSFPENIQTRYSRGDLCHGFFVSGQLATVGWSGANYMELNVNETLACPSAWGLFDFATMPTFQSRGYYTDALRQLTSMARGKGFRSSWIAVHPANIPSIKGIERAGFRPSRTVSKRYILGVSILSDKPFKH